jgi:hypothetical protein
MVVMVVQRREGVTIDFEKCEDGKKDTGYSMKAGEERQVLNRASVEAQSSHHLSRETGQVQLHVSW